MDTINFVPLRDNVLVEIIKPEEKTKSGIYLPDTAIKESLLRGTIVAVGAGKILNNGELLPMAVKINDIVLFSSYGGTEVTINNKKYLLLQMAELIAKEC